MYGYASLVEDEQEALWAMREITENMLPGRWEGSRVPPTKTEVKSTGVIRVRVVTVSCFPFSYLLLGGGGGSFLFFSPFNRDVKWQC